MIEDILHLKFARDIWSKLSSIIGEAWMEPLLIRAFCKLRFFWFLI